MSNAAFHEVADQQLSVGTSVNACQGRAEDAAGLGSYLQQNFPQSRNLGAMAKAGGPYMIDGMVMSPQTMQVPLALLHNPTRSIGSQVQASCADCMKRLYPALGAG